MNPLLEKALLIATKAHAGQTDKAGVPYVFHPIRVSCKCVTNEEKIVALLHDTIEDRHITTDFFTVRRISLQNNRCNPICYSK